MGQAAEEQRRLVLDQFTRQAVPFARLPAHSTEESIRLVGEAAGIGPQDTILDVACGPGLLACAFAGTPATSPGIDLTPAMIEQARALQRSEGLANLTWHVGDVASLPFPDGSFSVAFTRYSFHHLLDPAGVLAEMVRVTRPGGRVVVVDVYTSSPEQAEAYNHVERLRDPSHVRALGLDELDGPVRRRRTGRPDDHPLRPGRGAGAAAGRPRSPSRGPPRRSAALFAADLGADRLGLGRPPGGRTSSASPSPWRSSSGTGPRPP